MSQLSSSKASPISIEDPYILPPPEYTPVSSSRQSIAAQLNVLRNLKRKEKKRKRLILLFTVILFVGAAIGGVLFIFLRKNFQTIMESNNAERSSSSGISWSDLIVADLGTFTMTKPVDMASQYIIDENLNIKSISVKSFFNFSSICLHHLNQSFQIDLMKEYSVSGASSSIGKPFEQNVVHSQGNVSLSYYCDYLKDMSCIQIWPTSVHFVYITLELVNAKFNLKESTFSLLSNLLNSNNLNLVNGNISRSSLPINDTVLDSSSLNPSSFISNCNSASNVPSFSVDGTSSLGGNISKSSEPSGNYLITSGYLGTSIHVVLLFDITNSNDSSLQDYFEKVELCTRYHFQSLFFAEQTERPESSNCLMYYKKDQNGHTKAKNLFKELWFFESTSHHGQIHSLSIRSPNLSSDINYFFEQQSPSNMSDSLIHIMNGTSENLKQWKKTT